MVLRADQLPPSDGQSHKPAPLPTPTSSASFWHSEPSSFLLGHRTTPELPEYASVVVVGSGITGASAARYLADAGVADVVMLEAREACWGATGRNGGHLQPLLFDRTPEIAAWELENCREVADYISSNNIDCEFRQLTGCRTFWTQSLLDEASQAVEQLKKQAPEIGDKVDVVSSERELAEHKVKNNCPGASLTQGAASLWPYKYVAIMLETLIKAGKLYLHVNTPVTKVLPCRSQNSSSAARWTVHTPRGTMAAKHVLLATNAWTSHLLPGLSDVLVPVRGTMTALIPPVGSKILPNSYGFVGAGEGHNPHADDYLIQRPFSSAPNPTGHLMFGGGRPGGTLPSVGESDDTVVDNGSVKYLRSLLLKTLKLGGDANKRRRLEAEYAWSGIMCFSRDNSPWVGGVQGQPGLWLCAGYTGHGMPNATLCAKATVKLLLAEDNGEDAMSATADAVRTGALPPSYAITDARLAAARVLPTVKAQDETGVMAYANEQELVSALLSETK